MISMATALISAKVSAGSGPKNSQIGKVSAATAITAGTNPSVTLSTSAWIGNFEPCVSSTMRMICASTVSAPTLVARNEKAPVLLSTAVQYPATRRSKIRPRGGDRRHGARAYQIAGACHGALAPW
ncbi:hypothetical protein SAMN04244567_04096, partial [Paracoccus pantotrophus]